MTIASVSTLPATARADLDRLAGRGERELVRTARLAALHRALLRALPAFPAAAILALLAAMLGFGPVGVALVGLGIPLLVSFGLVIGGMAQVRAGRGEALGLIDRQLLLKGRMRAADRFIADGVTTGFGQAAIVDASRYFGGALDMPLDYRAPQFLLSRRARWVLAGSALLAIAALAIAVLWQSSQPDDGRPRQSPAAALGSALGIGADRSGRVADLDQAMRAVGGAGVRGATGAVRDKASGGGLAGGDSAAGTGASGSAARLAQSEGSGGAGAASGGGSSRERAAASPPTAGESGARSASGADRDGGDISAEGAQASGSSKADGGAAPRSTPIASGQAGARPQQDGAQSGQARRSSEGDGNQQSQSQARDGAQSQSQPGRGRDSHGRNGSNDSASEQKASFGVAGLLLGVPMADQLTGTRNPGPARRRYVDGPAPPAGAGGAQAQQRGAGTGRTGSQPQPSRSARETQMLRDWFARGNRR
jgi:hypothetical protein